MISSDQAQVKRNTVRSIGVLILSMLHSMLCQSEEKVRYEISLLSQAGAQFPIGSAVLAPPAADMLPFRLDIDYGLFQDYFLSMKEMKCLAGPELWCHIPYPYDAPTTVSSNDLRWLEHRLMFMFKDPRTFGARLWNGIYYKLEFVGDEIHGGAHYIDLNELSAPPDNPDLPPVDRDELLEVEAEKRWLPYLIMRPL